MKKNYTSEKKGKLLWRERDVERNIGQVMKRRIRKHPTTHVILWLTGIFSRRGRKHFVIAVIVLIQHTRTNNENAAKIQTGCRCQVIFGLL